jgi:hypothetical protein
VEAVVVGVKETILTTWDKCNFKGEKYGTF